MEFRILGPLEVAEEGRPVPLPGGKPSALLVCLLLNPNQAVSTERLIDDIWGEDPPGTAHKAVKNYVVQLRKAVSKSALVTRGNGYAIELEPDTLDLERFERLGGEGREALSKQRPERAADAFREALSLWRGDPLAEFSAEPFASTERARLEELRLSTLEDRIEADLTLGRHSDLVGELETLVSRHPLRERLRGQLMLALYRAGRQAEALAAYQEARREFVEGLGIDPGRDLQELERLILQHDSSLDVPSRREDEPREPLELAPEPESENRGWPKGQPVLLPAHSSGGVARSATSNER